VQLAGVLTDTVGLALANAVDNGERQMVDRLREMAAPVGAGGEPVPANVLQQLWADDQYASGSAEARNWTDATLQSIAMTGSSAHYLRGLIYNMTGDPTRARAEMERALALFPSNTRATEELQQIGQ
jgi:hypothetical protein